MSQERAPQVSIVMPVFERLPFLRLAVDSVLAQTHHDWELIVADDGSTGETRDWLGSLDDPRVRVLTLPHSGRPAVARNAALAVARGHWVAFLDSDDRWLPAKLQVQLAALHAAPERRWSYTAIHRVMADGAPRADEAQRTWIDYEGDIVEPLLRSRVGIATPTVMAARTLLQEAGGFDESLPVHEDMHLWIRLALRSGITCVREPLTEVRCHDQHHSLTGASAVEGWARMLLALRSEAVPGPRGAWLAAQLQRARAQAAARLARVHAAAGDRRAALRALGAGSLEAWRYGSWWYGAALATARLIAGPRVP